MAKEFVREGLNFNGRNDVFYLTDYFAVLNYYRALKVEVEENNEVPPLIPKNDFSEIPQEVAEELDDVINGILMQFESIDPTTNSDPIATIVAGELNMFGFIMHDPLLKKAIGNVAIEIFMRDAKITEEEAYERATEMLPEFMADFEDFLSDVTQFSMKQIMHQGMKHGVGLTEVRESMTPKVASIGWKGIKLHFETPYASSKKKKKDEDKTSSDDTDSMFG
tara:strand:+ start:734 stop:1399 length:666 start_codon:yes stop_codon:yes gene_type:complete